MKNPLLFIGIIVILIAVGVLVYWNFFMEKPLENKKMVQQAQSSTEAHSKSHPERSRRIAILIAFRDFRDEEYFIPKNILAQVGANISTVSTEKGTAIGADGGEAAVNLILDELNPSEFDAIIFIGGPGALKYLDNEKSYEIVNQTKEAGKVLGAICISPVILARAGVLDGKRATVWSSPLDRGPVKILKEQGAIYQDEQVVVDGKIVTANGPLAAKKFAEKFAEALTEALK